MRKIYFITLLLVLMGMITSQAQNVKPKRGDNRMWGFVDGDGKEIIPPKYDYASDFKNGISDVVLSALHGIVNDKGKELVSPRYNFTFYFIDGMARVQLNNKVGYIDSTGKEVIPLKYDGADHFYEGMAIVRIKDKYGFVNKKGEEVVPLQYDFCNDFKEGLGRVKLNGKWGFIDKTGKVVVAIQYDEVQVFSGGMASVELNGLVGKIDKKGNRVTEFVAKPIGKPIRPYISEEQKKAALCKERWDNLEFRKGITRKWAGDYIIMESYDCGTDQYRIYRPKQPGKDPYPSSAHKYSVIGGAGFREASAKSQQQFVACQSCNGTGRHIYTETSTKVKELPWGYFSGIETKKYTTTETKKVRICEPCNGEGIVLIYKQNQ